MLFIHIFFYGKRIGRIEPFGSRVSNIVEGVVYPGDKFAVEVADIFARPFEFGLDIFYRGFYIIIRFGFGKSSFGNVQNIVFVEFDGEFNAVLRDISRRWLCTL